VKNLKLVSSFANLEISAMEEKNYALTKVFFYFLGIMIPQPFG
jgi:hypothetical protein